MVDFVLAKFLINLFSIGKCSLSIDDLLRLSEREKNRVIFDKVNQFRIYLMFYLSHNVVHKLIITHCHKISVLDVESRTLISFHTAIVCASICDGNLLMKKLVCVGCPNEKDVFVCATPITEMQQSIDKDDDRRWSRSCCCRCAAVAEKQVVTALMMNSK